MAEDEVNENEDGENDDGEEGEEGEGGKKRSGKKLVFMIVAVLILLGGGGAGAYFMGFIGGGESEEMAADGHGEDSGHGAAHEAVTDEDGDEGHDGHGGGGGVYVPIDKIVVALRGDNPRDPVNLSLEVSILVGSEEDKSAIEHNMPAIMDGMQGVLRELRLDDLQGSAGLMLIREELLRRVKVAVPPDVNVSEVLIQSMITQ